MTIAPQFAKYSGVAATSALVDWLCYSVFIFFGTYYLTAQIFARLAGGLYAFFANKYWSFSRNDLPGIGVEARRFLLLYVFSYFLSITLLWVAVERIGLTVFIAKILADGTCCLVNFAVMRGYVFNPRIGILTRIRLFVKRL